MPGKFTCESEHSPQAHERRRLVLTLHQGTMREPPIWADASSGRRSGVLAPIRRLCARTSP